MQYENFILLASDSERFPVKMKTVELMEAIKLLISENFVEFWPCRPIFL